MSLLSFALPPPPHFLPSPLPALGMGPRSYLFSLTGPLQGGRGVTAPQSPLIPRGEPSPYPFPPPPCPPTPNFGDGRAASPSGPLLPSLPAGARCPLCLRSHRQPCTRGKGINIFRSTCHQKRLIRTCNFSGNITVKCHGAVGRQPREGGQISPQAQGEASLSIY